MMTNRQRGILERIVKDTDKRIDHVHYMRGGSHTKDSMFVEYAQFRRDGSGVRVRLVYEPDGYPSMNIQEELKT
jgi:hypothetical protein